MWAESSAGENARTTEVVIIVDGSVLQEFHKLQPANNAVQHPRDERLPDGYPLSSTGGILCSHGIPAWHNPHGVSPRP